MDSNLKFDFNSKIELKSKEKIDSLLPIYQKKESKKWKGYWKLKQLKTNRFNYQKILISEKEISFFNKLSDTIPIRIEKINHTDYKPGDLSININSVKFRNNEVWEFSIKKNKNEIRLFPNLKTDSIGNTWISIYERSMIKDTVNRIKAMTKEIRTYYIQIK